MRGGLARFETCDALGIDVPALTSRPAGTYRDATMIPAQFRITFLVAAALLCTFCCPTLTRAVQEPAKQLTPAQVLADVMRRWVEILEPRPGQPAKTFKTQLTLVKSAGLPDEIEGASLDL